jgi:hypothetical protein
MSGVERHRSGTHLKPVGAAPELCIVVACHTFVCAIPTRLVQRLALGQDLERVESGGDALLRANGEWFAGADLGELLGLRPLDGAWALLKLSHRGHHVPIALRTGACLEVRNVAVEAPLAGGLFEQRGEAVLGAFVAEREHARDATYGLVLDVQSLFSAAELTRAESALARVERKPT